MKTHTVDNMQTAEDVDELPIGKAVDENDLIQFVTDDKKKANFMKLLLVQLVRVSNLM